MSHAILIPLDIPETAKPAFINAYHRIVQPSGRLLLIASDHAVEHCQPLDFATIFSLANQATLPLATHLETIARYAQNPTLGSFMVKLNGKTNLIPLEQSDPFSPILSCLQDVLKCKQQSQLPICGVGYTLYPGSEYENSMLQEAENTIFHAHQNGLVTILWIYPRGKAIPDELDPQLIIKMAALGNALGADFIKVKIPRYKSFDELKTYVNAIAHAAGNSKIIFSGGEIKDADYFLDEIKAIIAAHTTTGLALGRNIIQRPTSEAQKILHTIIKIMNS